MPETTPAKKTAAKKAAASPTKAEPEALTEHASLAAALVAFMHEKPLVAKTQTATIPGRDGRSGYSYKYADLADVDDAATPVLAKHGLAFVTVPRRTDSGAYELVGTLIHGPTGEKLEGPLPLQGRTAQELGSSLTYMRRYLMAAMTGIVTDEDDDGSRAEAARAYQARPETPPEEQPRESRSPHAEATYALLQSLTEQERYHFGPWWEREAQQGNLPLRSHIEAITPQQAAWVAEVVDNMRARARMAERAAEEGRESADETRSEGEGPADPQ